MYCLCYNESRGLYIDRSNILTSESLLMDYTQNRKNQFSLGIPNTDITIKVFSYLAHGKSSYLYAEILHGSKYLLNFSDSNQLRMIQPNSGSISSFSVEPGQWFELFSIIIETYKSELSVKIIEEYFSQLNKLLEQNSIKLFNYYYKNPVYWNNDFLVLLHFSDKLANIIRMMPKSIVGNIADVHFMLVESCINLLNNIISRLDFEELDHSNSRLKRLSNNLYEIFGYLRERGDFVTFLQTLQKTCKQSE